MLQVGGSALGGVGSQVGALGQLAKTATTPVGRGIAQTLSQQPARQVAAAFPAGATSQYVTEESGSPLAGAAAGILTSIPFSIGAKGILQAPTVKELKGQASQQYKFAEEAGAIFKKNPYKQFAESLESTLVKEGMDETLTPKVVAALKRINQEKGSNVTLEKIEILRRIGRGAASSIDANESRIGNIIIDKLDDFVENAQSTQLTKGSPEAIRALVDARELWKRAKKTEIIDELVASAELRAEANYTQSGIENALRRKLVNLADNPKKLRAFSKEEQELIKSTAKGGPIQNALRLAGKLSPTGAIPAAIGGGAGLVTAMGTTPVRGAYVPPEYKGGPLSRFKYDPDTYNPDVVKPPNPPYRPVYAAEGGLMSLAMGGPAPQTNFANPAQSMMGTSQYAMATDPMTGNIAQRNMAKGGAVND
jgi:hypothetical protein